MRLNFRIFDKGIRLKSDKGTLSLIYPRKIWQKFDKKERNFLLDNIAYLNTICVPLVSGINELIYNTSKPFFRKYFDNSILKDIPSTVEEYKESAKSALKKFKSAKYKFNGKKTKNPFFNPKTKTSERAVVLFSCGKDSLMTLALCNEINLKPVPVYVNDTVSPSENALKIKLIKKISKENKLDFGIVENSIEKLNDFEFWDKDETDKGYSHLIINFCLLSLPFLKFYNSKYLVLGNELDLNSTFTNKEGLDCYPSYDQSFEGTKRLNNLMKKSTQNKINVSSIISPLHDLAIMKILHQRYPAFGKYQSSCPGLDASRQKRWCHNCTDCVSFFVCMNAIGKDPKTIGIMKNLFNKKYIKHHILFNPKEKGRYDKAGGDEQLKFAYYLAYKNGAKGHAIDLFKKKFMNEMKEKEDKLYKKYFSVHSTALIPKKIRKKVASIYKEELSSS